MSQCWRIAMFVQSSKPLMYSVLYCKCKLRISLNVVLMSTADKLLHFCAGATFVKRRPTARSLSTKLLLLSQTLSMCNHLFLRISSNRNLAVGNVRQSQRHGSTCRNTSSRSRRRGRSSCSWSRSQEKWHPPLWRAHWLVCFSQKVTPRKCCCVTWCVCVLLFRSKRFPRVCFWEDN